MASVSPRGAYSGFRIVDFSEGVAGALAAMLLADFGAEVLRIEAENGSTLARSPGYEALNRGKRVLRHELPDEGEEVTAELRAVLAGADVVIFDKSPSAMQAGGFSAELLTRANPSLIHAWFPAYGTSGPWRDLPARHSLLNALSGYAWRQGAESDVPIDLVVPFGWYGQGVLGTSMIGAALYERTRSGAGQALTVSGLHAYSQLAGPVRELNRPRIPRASAFGSNPRSRIYRCADNRFLFVCAFFPSFYRSLFEVLGNGDLFDLFTADDEAARNLLDGVFTTRPRDEWMAKLKQADIPCAPVQGRDDWNASEAVTQAGQRLVFQHPNLGTVAMPAPPAELSATPMTVSHLQEPVDNLPAWKSITAKKGPGQRSAPLADIRVLNLGTVLAGAQPGAILSFLGADVIKVEAPGGDQFRYDPGFLALNRGTRSLCIDIAKPDGKEMFFDLVRKSDVVIDNYRSGVRERLGIGYDELKAINPGIISCSLTAYGDRGERALVPGFDPLLQAESGLMCAQGGDGDPVSVTMGMNDLGSASVICSALLAALNHRDRSGVGQEIRTSLLAQSLLFQLAEFVNYSGRPETAKGGRDFSGPRALHRYYPCMDGWLAIACETEAEVRSASLTLGFEIVSPEQALAASPNGEIAVHIETILKNHSRDEVVARLISAGVPVAPVIDMAEVFYNADLRENRYIESWDHPTRGSVLSTPEYACFSASPSGFARHAPDLGEHSREVLEEHGVTEEMIGNLLNSGAVFQFNERDNLSL